MAFFEDKTYTDMDWLNRAIEPYDWPELNKFHAIPERIEIDIKDILAILKREFYVEPRKFNMKDCGYFRTIDNRSMDSHWFISGLVPKYIEKYITIEQLRNVQDIDTNYFLDKFKLEMDEIQIDLTTQTLSGNIAIVRQNIPEQKIPEALESIIDNLFYFNSHLEKDSLNRMKEIIDIIGIPDNERSILRSSSKTSYYLTDRLRKIVKEDEWRIKKVDLIFKMVRWVRAYISHGNLAALTNFTKLKCMTHKGVAIYSMEEVK